MLLPPVYPRARHTRAIRRSLALHGLWVLAVLQLLSGSRAQPYTLAGRVQDAETLEPLAFAIIKTLPNEAGNSTDVD
ncbi:MAG: hypothetical protein ACK5XP_10530, partial [Sphingobacteriia bacterium]